MSSARHVLSCIPLGAGQDISSMTLSLFFILSLDSSQLFFLCFWRTVQKDVEKETSIFIRTFFHNHWLILLFSFLFDEPVDKKVLKIELSLDHHVFLELGNVWLILVTDSNKRQIFLEN